MWHICLHGINQLHVNKTLVCIFKRNFVYTIVISKYILINFQTNPMICIYLLTFINELLDSPSVGSVSGSGSITSVGGEGANLSVIVYL